MLERDSRRALLRLLVGNHFRWSRWQARFDGLPVYGLGPDPEFAIATLLGRYGRNFPFRPKPDDIPLGAVGKCFNNALVLAHDRGLTYAEGLALLPEGWYFHGWCIDGAGVVVDNTWRTPGTRYFGIAFRTDYAVRFRQRFDFPLLTFDSPLVTGEDASEAAVLWR